MKMINGIKPETHEKVFKILQGSIEKAKEEPMEGVVVIFSYKDGSADYAYSLGSHYFAMLGALVDLQNNLVIDQVVNPECIID